MFSTIRQEIRQWGEYRFGPWGSLWHRVAVSSWRWSIALCKFEEHWALHLFCFWVTLWQARTPPKDILESWGFTYDREFSCLHLNWGSRCKILHMPWSYDHCLTKVMLEDGRFIHWKKYPRLRGPDGGLCENPEPVGMYRRVFPYHYTLRSGEAQARTATVTVERRSWCWRAWPFRVLRWPSKVRTSIDVTFSDEVGERSGSWKGGCIGCGYDLRPDETPEACLRRMERERRF